MSVVTLCGSLSVHPAPLGRAMHEAGYAALGLRFTYVPFRVTSLAGAIAGMRALGIRGLGVSHPFKQEVIPYLDALDPVAARIGAVNTVVNDDGRLVGHNTDWIGAILALEEVTSLERVRVLLLGAGGAARAIAYGLRERSVTFTIANRDPAKAAVLADAVGADAVGLESLSRASEYDVVINATSRGMVGQDPSSPVPPEAIRHGQIVMDIVYKPIETALVAIAQQRGAIAVHGGRMLLHQAARQFELYTGRPAPLDAMDAALREAIGEPH